MIVIGFRIIVLMSLLGFGLSACTTQTAPTNTHPEGYDGVFGGDGEHKHQVKDDLA